MSQRVSTAAHTHAALSEGEEPTLLKLDALPMPSRAPKRIAIALAVVAALAGGFVLLWPKKVLEWSESPEAAYRILEQLNNTYAMDGRDPNSYTGILWCFGLFDRPWPPKRKVFGNIRFMSSDNTAKKFKLGGYYEYVGRLKGKKMADLIS